MVLSLPSTVKDRSRFGLGFGQRTPVLCRILSTGSDSDSDPPIKFSKIGTGNLSLKWVSVTIFSQCKGDLVS